MEELLGVVRLGTAFKGFGGGLRSLGEGYLAPQQAFAKYPGVAVLEA